MHCNASATKRILKAILGLLACGLAWLPVHAQAASPASQPTSQPAKRAQPASRPAKAKEPVKRPVPRVATPTKQPKAPAKRSASPTPPRRTTPLASVPKRPAATPRTATPRTSTPAKPTARRRRYTGRMKKGIGFISNLLHKFLMQHGRDPNNPWMLAHLLLAFGKDLKLKDGTKAIDRIVSGYLKFKKAGKRTVSYFPPGTFKNRIEPHPYMHLKNFLELGVPLSYKFKVGKRTITLQQMLNDSIYTFPAAPKKNGFGQLAWRMIALYGRTPGGQWTWTNHKGHTVNFFRILFKAFKYTNHQCNFLRVWKANGVTKFVKRRQYIYKESCGGFHLIQSTMRWMGHPGLIKHTRSALNTHKELIFYRMKGEVKLYLSLFKQHQNDVARRFLVLLQQLKFLGHALETLVNLHEWGLFTPTKEQRKEIRHAVRLLLVTVMLLHRLGFYKGVNRLKQGPFQFYLDLIGDSSHALHALRKIQNTNLYRP